MDNPKPPYVCDFEDCERLRVPSTTRCREHPKPRKERATYRCKICDQLHFSGGFCHEHQGHAAQDEDTQPVPIFQRQNGTPDDLAGAREFRERKLTQLWTDLGNLLRWEQQQNRDEEGDE